MPDSEYQSLFNSTFRMSSFVQWTFYSWLVGILNCGAELKLHFLFLINYIGNCDEGGRG